MVERRILVWFRNDLRLHDNEVLAEAVSKSERILPVYIFDPRHFGFTRYQSYKAGSHRIKFLVESVAALRAAFQRYGGDLLILQGHPEELLPDLVTTYGITEVYHHREVANEETEISSNVEDALWKVKINLKHFIGHTLYNKEDLPFPIKDIPDNFARFKKKTEREAIVKECIKVPVAMDFVVVPDYGTVPLPDALSTVKKNSYATHFKGGEAQSLQVLQNLIDHSLRSVPVGKAKKFYTKLSPWLALGCLSPRMVYWEIKKAEQMYGVNPISNQVIIGLLWRDYFRFMFKKYGNNFFKLTGFTNKLPYKIQKDAAALAQWKAGKTANDTINRIMQQLNQTGIISYPARRLAALYLIQIQHIDWTFGAAYFEEKLIDYTAATNWGSWANLAGVGNEQPQKPIPDFETQLKNFESLEASTLTAA